MKNAMKWKILMITCAVCLLPIFLGVVLWNQLPDTIAVHFNLQNTPDRYASKGFTVFGLPFYMVILQVICCLINDVNAKKHGDRKKLELATKWIIPVMTLLLQSITLGYALGLSIDIRRWAMGISGAIFLVVGNYLPKLDYIKSQNTDSEKARKINRFLGFLSVVMGLLAMATLLLPPIFSLIWLFLLIPYAVIGTVYTAVKIKK